MLFSQMQILRTRSALFNDSFELRAMPSSFYFGNGFLTLAQHLINGVHMSDPLARALKKYIHRQLMKKYVEATL